MDDEKPIGDQIAVNVLTLRDYYAAAALTGFLANSTFRPTTFHADDNASWLYTLADAMLAERAKGRA